MSVREEIGYNGKPWPKRRYYDETKKNQVGKPFKTVQCECGVWISTRDDRIFCKACNKVVESGS